MPAKKKSYGIAAIRDHEGSKVSRAHKRMSENLQAIEKKVTDLITSSTRKHRLAGSIVNNGEDLVTTNLNPNFDFVRNESSDVCFVHDAITDDSVVHKASSVEGTDEHVLETIFSPNFHMAKHGCLETDSGDGCVEYLQNGDGNFHHENDTKHSRVDVLSSRACQETTEVIVREEKNYSDNAFAINVTYPGTVDLHTDMEEATISSEVSAIYLAMKNSKLECVDEHGPDPMLTTACVDDDDYEEFDDFDPYLFIKNLPDLSSVVPTFRPLLLPKQTRSCPPTTLVLDLDETLVHSTLEPCDDADFTFLVNFNLQEHTVYVRCRPHLMEFLNRVSRLFEIIIFTASQSIYAEQLLNVLDPKRKIFRHRVFRESCVYVEGNYLKDLTILGRDLARIMIIDNSPQAFGFQVDNGIPIESWFDDRSDKELLLLLPFLESLVGMEDVRPLIASKFNLREKVTAAVYHLRVNRGNHFET